MVKWFLFTTFMVILSFWLVNSGIIRNIKFFIFFLLKTTCGWSTVYRFAIKTCVVEVVLVLPRNVLSSVNADPSRPHSPSGTVYFYRLHLKYIFIKFFIILIKLHYLEKKNFHSFFLENYRKKLFFSLNLRRNNNFSLFIFSFLFPIHSYCLYNGVTISIQLPFIQSFSFLSNIYCFSFESESFTSKSKISSDSGLSSLIISFGRLARQHESMRKSMLRCGWLIFIFSFLSLHTNFDFE